MTNTNIGCQFQNHYKKLGSRWQIPSSEDTEQLLEVPPLWNILIKRNLSFDSGVNLTPKLTYHSWCGFIKSLFRCHVALWTPPFFGWLKQFSDTIISFILGKLCTSFIFGWMIPSGMLTDTLVWIHFYNDIGNILLGGMTVIKNRFVFFFS